MINALIELFRYQPTMQTKKRKKVLAKAKERRRRWRKRLKNGWYVQPAPLCIQ
jgi:hypothetical protein